MDRDPQPLEVYYDSACPLCRREVALYRRLDREDRIRWVDLHAPGAGPEVHGIGRDEALRRLHAFEAGGRAVSGARAFAAIWERIPGLRTLGRLTARRPFIWLAEGGYRGFLRVRPAVSGTLARLERRRS
jgi:predicted DCC family thiol-disulfide oxidoreductase YuxK